MVSILHLCRFENAADMLPRTVYTQNAVPTGTMLSPLHLLCPEVILGAPVNEKLDIWLFGHLVGCASPVLMCVMLIHLVVD